MLRLKIAIAVMYMVGAAAIFLSVSGSGGRNPSVPLVLGIVALLCGVILTVLMIRGRRGPQR